jgi:hypothetical protein
MTPQELEDKIRAMTGGAKGLGMTEEQWNEIVLRNR